jgi:hypothetical protein
MLTAMRMGETMQVQPCVVIIRKDIKYHDLTKYETNYIQATNTISNEDWDRNLTTQPSTAAHATQLKRNNTMPSLTHQETDFWLEVISTRNTNTGLPA